MYAPIWFVNKTGLPLFYRVCGQYIRGAGSVLTLRLVPQMSHTKDVIEHSPGNKIQLFSFGSKTDGKKVRKSYGYTLQQVYS